MDKKENAKILVFVYGGYVMRYLYLIIVIPFYGRVLGVTGMDDSRIDLGAKEGHAGRIGRVHLENTNEARGRLEQRDALALKDRIAGAAGQVLQPCKDSLHLLRTIRVPFARKGCGETVEQTRLAC